MKNKKYLILLLVFALIISNLTGCNAFKSVEKLSLISSKKIYIVGDEFNGAKIQATYSDDSIEQIDITEDMISGFDTSTAGVKTVVITYKNKVLDFDIKVVEKYLASLSIKENSKVNFVQNTEYQDGLITLLANYSDETVQEICVTSDMITNFSTVELGNKNIEISYMDLVRAYEINVVAPTAISVTLNSKTQTEYFVGDEFKGVVVDVEYNNGLKAKETITSLDKIVGFNTQTDGEKQITATCYGTEIQFNIIVKKQVLSISAVDCKEVYLLNQEFGEGNIKVVYSNNSEEKIAISSEMLKDFDTSTYGKHTIKVEYGNKECSFDIMVAFIDKVGTYKIQAENTEFCDYSQATLTNSATTPFENTTKISTTETKSNEAEGYSTANISVVGNKIIIKFYSAIEGSFVLGARGQSASNKGMSDQLLSGVISLIINSTSVDVLGTYEKSTTTAWMNMINWTECNISASVDLIKGENTIVIECIDSGTVRFPNFDYFTLAVA